MRPKARVLALVLLVSLANAQQEPALKQDPKQALPAAGDETGVAAAAVREVATVQEVEESVKQAAELRSTVQRVINRLIAKDAPGDLANQGLGDISPTGACKEEIARHCKKKKPGARRLAKCLWDHLEEQDDKDDEEEASFSHECRAELDALEQDAAGNVNKNIPLALACKEDIEERCQDVEVGQPGALLACLRRKRRELRAPCKKQVFIAMLMSAQDLRLDLQAWKECSADAKRLCPTVAAHRGRIQWCLRNNTGSLSWECKAQLFRRDLERSADVRLSVRLLKKCMADKQKFCADIEPGESRVKDCLEEHMLEDDLSKECGEELAAMVQARSTNFRMDSKIREYCAQDVERLCGIPQATMVSENLTQHEDSIQRCLQDYRRELRSPACSARVSRMVALSMADIRFNHPLADACAADRASLCGSVPPGSARVIRCLKAKRDELAEGCAAMLFDQEQVMAENIDFQFPLKRACTAEIFKYCGAVPHGRGRVARCLQLNLEQGQAFSRGCRQELQASEARAAQDYRLNARLRDACQKTIAALCSQACGSLTKKAACGGTVLQCLTEQYDSIDEQDCKAEVFYFMKMEVRDFRNDVFLAEACRSDVDRYCQEHIETGHGRVVQCLHDNRDRLTAGCRAEEIKLDVMQSSNIELRPSLARACAEERQQHCADVRPGKARVLDCLLAQADKVDFSEQCRKVLGSQQAQRLQDWRRDFGMRTACSNDVGEVCGDAAEQADSQDGSVFRCLLAGGDGVSRGCQRAMSHAASAALQFYQLSMPGLEACDQDVLRHCSINGQVPQAVGQVKGCLGARLAYDRAVLANRTVPAQILPAILPPRPVEVGAASEPGNPGGGRRLSEASPGSKAVRRRQRAPILSQACRDVLDVASPEDSLASLESGLSTNAVLSSLAGVEKALGLEEGALQNKHQEGTKVLTLTGWVAVVALFGLGVATVGGGLYAVRRFTDPARNGYTRVIKHIPLADR